MSSDQIVIDRQIADWVSAVYYGAPGNITGPSFGVLRDGDIIAGFTFHDWQPGRGTIELSAAATERGWLTREFLRLTGGYAFSQLGCRMLVVRTSERNVAVRGIFRKLGGKEHRIEQLRGPGEAEIFITLTKEAWSEYEAKL